ncbi:MULTISPECIES: bifunctional 3-deoxy-7-phosphoheptulonate synthase/chorismate mutase [Exiguobacterium]|uniref:Phospho-2-dehydro-3-deoxyheptonate aldolase n=1 Tax=Exiguobacterium sibiricum (strain DSM 17290 / CCUG 55495 / CIP 109462 / JCM 13490 / 255-15) TaxID=262543 RepID=B1YKE2_EXIS2|nr:MULTISPECIES: bifunctional 3-deoxy-7-phosphoheptulonate synthase/chorismate mutase [Exiguobacterium]ACB61695.1 phospho-2-dehydro-3-deoxyheptonate aldolase [Exiguobacterium sibiricum 255-15]MCT4792223.1 bifunctional 3-deoxy-7-phosphoheptulonate synthase/chorismate mutase [Exiguobacterium artemiae]
MDQHAELKRLRDELDLVNAELLALINKRGEIAVEIGEVKRAQGIDRYDPVRERQMLESIAASNHGPFETGRLQHVFKEIFKASLELQGEDRTRKLLVSRKQKPTNTIIRIGDDVIGDGSQQLIAGPCAVESEEQVFEVAEQLAKHGVRFMRGGAYKPRTSPYDFQGLGLEGLKMLKKAADAHGLHVISEIMTPSAVESALPYVDIIQVGARNMQNFDLLKEVGRTNKPVLLKRGLSATLEEFMYAAEYIMASGNEQVILCERGIRTYERATRNTLDISAVPILKQETHLPVMVDVTHSTGRKDLLLPTAKAAYAIGADAVMVEVHPFPALALSDANQQLDFNEFDSFIENLTSTFPALNVQ